MTITVSQMKNIWSQPWLTLFKCGYLRYLCMEVCVKHGFVDLEYLEED